MSLPTGFPSIYSLVVVMVANGQNPLRQHRAGFFVPPYGV